MPPRQIIENFFLSGIFIEDKIKTILVLAVIDHGRVVLQIRRVVARSKPAKDLNIILFFL